jgi:hypothetical protein
MEYKFLSHFRSMSLVEVTSSGQNQKISSDSCAPFRKTSVYKISANLENFPYVRGLKTSIKVFLRNIRLSYRFLYLDQLEFYLEISFFKGAR